VEGVGPGAVARPVAKGGVERDGVTHRHGLIGTGRYDGGGVGEGRGGRRGAGGALRIGDGEADGVAAGGHVCVAWRDPGSRAAVAEVPGVAQLVTVVIRRAAAVEGDGDTLRRGVGSARR